MNDSGHHLFQETDCAIRRKVGHGVIVSCIGQRNMIYNKFPVAWTSVAMIVSIRRLFLLDYVIKFMQITLLI